MTTTAVSGWRRFWPWARCSGPSAENRYFLAGSRRRGVLVVLFLLFAGAGIGWALWLLWITGALLLVSLSQNVVVGDLMRDASERIATELANREGVEIRYYSVSLGESSHRPHTPAEVLRNRYGDCKDKSLLLVTILALGVAVYFSIRLANRAVLDLAPPPTVASMREMPSWSAPFASSQNGTPAARAPA